MKLTESYLRKIVKEELKKVLVKEEQEVEQIGGLSNAELGALEALSFQQEYGAREHYGSASAYAVKKLYDAMAARSNGMLPPVKIIRPILASLVEKGFAAIDEEDDSGRFYYVTEAGNDLLIDNGQHPILNLLSKQA